MRSRAKMLASAVPIDTWPSADSSGLNQKRQERFEMLCKAMRMYFAGTLGTTIAKITGVDFTCLQRYARKCLRPASDGRIAGFRGLLPYIRSAPYKRLAPEAPKRPEQQGGQSGLLNALFSRIPELENELQNLIRQQAKRHAVKPQRLRMKDVHKLFLELLIKHQIGRQEWPFTTKHLGVRAVGQYTRRMLDRNFAESVRNWGDQPAKAHLAVGTGMNAFLKFDEPFDAVEIDSYHIDAHFTVAFKTPENDEIDLLLQRLWLLAVIDVRSSAILAYEIVFRSEVTADDILRVIRKATSTRWEPKKLTVDGLSYGEGAGFPSGLIPEAYGAQWSVTLFDGALAHLAINVRDRARRALGFVINWGPVRHFERRPNIERAFKQIATDVFQRLPSTTGSNPFQGRAEKGEEKALKLKIRAEHAEEYLDVYLANFNATPSEGQYNRSPLEVLEYYIGGSNPISLPRKLPETLFETTKTLACRQNAVVRGGRATGRRPYIQIDRVRYTSPILAEAGDLIGHTLVVDIDEEDMRQVRAFLSDGQELGVLTAHGKWCVTKHSRRTRRAINSLIFRRILILSQFDDPVLAYLEYLKKVEASANNSKVKKKRMLTPKQVTQVALVARDGEVLLQLKNAPEAPRIKSIGDLVSRRTILVSPMPEVKTRNRR